MFYTLIISPASCSAQTTGKQTALNALKVKCTCIVPFVKLQLKTLRYGSHRVAPANYTIPASTLRTFARWCHLNGRHLIQLATYTGATIIADLCNAISK